MTNDTLLEIRDLRTYFNTEGGIAKAVDGVSFDINKGEVLGVVGESGSGKSVTALSIMRLIPNPPGEIVGGSITMNGVDLLKLPLPEMRKLRGHDIGMIFQEPMTSLNPVYRIGTQVMETVLQHKAVSKNEAFDRAVEMLDLVGIPDARRRMNDYPHQFSGGMRQRVMIAMALACNPSLLIADEPTTALDVTIQAQILELMINLKEERKDSAIVLITHDLAVVAEMCQRIVVMYGGKVQEIGSVRQIFNNALHPYTQGLLDSIPRPKRGERLHRLRAIPGMVPNILQMPAACKFNSRCNRAMEICFAVEPELVEMEPGHFVRCHLYPQPTRM
ncbi:MAG: ABC transporter ATP-binding protein [Bacteroidetes bacterium]|nr:ABC transporter ATP-binding protein [Bacteroidota bacterium]